MNNDLYVTASGERDTSASENAEEAARAMVSEDNVWQGVYGKYAHMDAIELQRILVSLIVSIGMNTPEKHLNIDLCELRVSEAIEEKVQHIIENRNAR